MMKSLKGSILGLVVIAVVIATVVGAPILAFAEGAEGHAEHTGIPMSVMWQAINFVLYIGLLVYFLKTPVRDFFRTRRENYEQALVRADQARKEAERKKREIEERLAKLENGAGDSLATARAEAAALATDIQKQGQELALRLRDEAGRSATHEIERAKTELRHELLVAATAASQKMLQDKMQANDQKRLQSEFVEKIVSNGIQHEVRS